MARLYLALVSLFLATFLHAEDSSYGISGNPGAVNITTGNGDLGRWLGISECSGVKLGGMWLGDYNYLMSGNEQHRRWTGNSSLIFDLFIDLEQAFGWCGSSFGAEFLQFNGQATNADAGIVQGYNSLPGSPPLNRSELYQLWLRQTFFEDKFILRLGKVVPTYHFNNVSKPVPTKDPAISIPSVTGLIYTPVFVNTTLLGAIGGYYNSVYGIVATIAPSKQAYINMGFFDGNLARGSQTGLKGPHFNGYYFSIMEVGYGWAYHKPGVAAIGGWYQSSKLHSDAKEQDGTGGIYAFASQALWIKELDRIGTGNISGFIQLGWNNSKTMPMNRYLGLGLTAFALIDSRPNDSFGAGLAWSRLNSYTFSRHSELMLQAYYQAHVVGSVYFQPIISYIPTPGANSSGSAVWAATGRLCVAF